MNIQKQFYFIIIVCAGLAFLLAAVFGAIRPVSLYAQPSTASSTTPQVGSDPCEIPVPPIETPMGKLPGVDELLVRKEMPDVLTMDDGTKVTTLEQWKKRREEIKRILEYYATGQIPPAPGNVKGVEVLSETLAQGEIKYRLVHLTFGPEEKLSLNIVIFTPSEGGPFPAIILQGGTPPGAVPLPRLPQGGNTNTADDPVEGPLGYPSARNLSFSNVRLHDASEIVRAVKVAPEKPVQGLSLTNLTGTAAKGMNLCHIRDLVLKDINVTGFSGPLLTTEDVTGTGLD